MYQHCLINCNKCVILTDIKNRMDKMDHVEILSFSIELFYKSITTLKQSLLIKKNLTSVCDLLQGESMSCSFLYLCLSLPSLKIHKGDPSYPIVNSFALF